MIIKGASVFCEDGTFQVKDVFVEDHKIVATETEVSDKTVVDAKRIQTDSWSCGCTQPWCMRS